MSEVPDRFLEVVQCADSATFDDGTYESLPEPSAVGAARVAGITLASASMAAVMEIVVALSTEPGGFSSGELSVKIQQRLDISAVDYQSCQAAYDLKKLRGKVLVRKISMRLLYESPAEGLPNPVAFGMSREKALQPVLRNRNLQGPPPRTNNPIDQNYYILRHEMQRLFTTLKISA